jgi:hypothetical protein
MRGNAKSFRMAEGKLAHRFLRGQCNRLWAVVVQLEPTAMFSVRWPASDGLPEGIPDQPPLALGVRDPHQNTARFSALFINSFSMVNKRVKMG